MAGSTPIYSFPYPESSDLVANYPTLGQDLAEDVETVISQIGNWQTYTPDFVNWTYGNATSTSKYTQIGKTVIVRFHITFGSTTSFTADPLAFSLPISTATYPAPNQPMGIGIYSDASLGTGYTFMVSWYYSNLVFPQVMVTSGSFATRGAITNSSPITPAQGDIIIGTFIYEAA